MKYPQATKRSESIGSAGSMPSSSTCPSKSAVRVTLGARLAKRHATTKKGKSSMTGRSSFLENEAEAAMRVKLKKCNATRVILPTPNRTPGAKTRKCCPSGNKTASRKNLTWSSNNPSSSGSSTIPLSQASQITMKGLTRILIRRCLTRRNRVAVYLVSLPNSWKMVMVREGSKELSTRILCRLQIGNSKKSSKSCLRSLSLLSSKIKWSDVHQPKESSSSPSS